MYLKANSSYLPIPIEAAPDEASRSEAEWACRRQSGVGAWPAGEMGEKCFGSGIVSCSAVIEVNVEKLQLPT